MNALRNKFETKNEKPLKFKKVIPFSSDKKYSKVELEDISYYLGAPEFIIENSNYENYSKDYRTLLLAVEENGKKSPVALILIQDKIRKEAKNTLKYFKEQGVNAKRDKELEAKIDAFNGNPTSPEANKINLEFL